MNFDDQRRIYHHKRNAVGADTKLGHRYSNAIGHLEHLENLQREQTRTLKEIDELEFEEIL